MGKNPIYLKLRVYKGKQMSYDAQGNVQNENQLIKLPYNSKEFINFKNNIIANGYLKVEVLEANEVEKKKQEDNTFKDVLTKIEDVSAIEKEIAEVYEVLKPKLTPEQQKIAELEAKLDALLNGDKPKKEQKAKVEKTETAQDKSDNNEEIVLDEEKLKSEDLSEVRAYYEEVLNKKPFGGWKIEEVKNKLREQASK